MGPFAGDDVGKPVIAQDGERVGTVAEVRDGTAYVEPAADLDERTRSELRWDGPVQTETEELNANFVSDVSGHDVRLRV